MTLLNARGRFRACLATTARSCPVSEALVLVRVTIKERPCPLHEAEHISRQPLQLLPWQKQQHKERVMLARKVL